MRMEKYLVQGSFWLGLASSVVALVWKGLDVLNVVAGGLGGVTYMTLYKGGLLFLVISIATTGYVGLRSQKP